MATRVYRISLDVRLDGDLGDAEARLLCEALRGFLEADARMICELASRPATVACGFRSARQAMRSGARRFLAGARLWVATLAASLRGGIARAVIASRRSVGM